VKHNHVKTVTVITRTEMESPLWLCLCLVICAVTQCNAGYFANRNETRRMYYEALKNSEKAKALELFTALGKPKELEQTLKELVVAANFADASANVVVSAGAEYTDEPVLHIHDVNKNTNVIDREKKKQDDVGKVGEEFDEGKKERKIKINNAALVVSVGEEYVPENSFKMPNAIRKRPRKEGRRRRRRRRKNRVGSRRIPGYVENEINSNTINMVQSDQRHSRDVDGEEGENEAETHQLISDLSSNAEKTDIKKKSPESPRFNWQKPAGQWHLPTGQFQPISGNFETFARSKRRRANMLSSSSLKYMVYTGELDNKMRTDN